MLLKEFKTDRLLVRAFAGRDEMGAFAAAEAAGVIRTLLAEKDEVNIMFAAAPSQNDVLDHLLQEEGIAWERINAFHMDEYVGMDPQCSASFCNYLTRTIFARRPFKSVHYLQGLAADPDGEARRYEEVLRVHPLDLCFMGIGENGHVAFNDPPVADFDDPRLVKVVELETACRMQQVHDGCFPSLEDVPTHALTVTVPGLLQAKTLICCVPSSTKAAAVRAAVEDPVSTACPATILRTHRDARLYVDEAAGTHIL